jgi:hypothetical protein
VTSQTLNITVNGDLTPEAIEIFNVNLEDLEGAQPGDMQGAGTILNDDN